MSATVESLLRDLLDWLASQPRSYTEVMDAWRTSCPRLPVWEEANERGFIAHVRVDGETIVELTPGGHAFLGRIPDSPSAAPAEAVAAYANPFARAAAA